MNRCPICGTLAANPLAPLGGHDASGYGCPRCGPYYLSGTATAVLPALIEQRRLNASLLSHHLRIWFDGHGKPTVIYERDLKPFQEDLAYAPAQQQLDRLLLWIGANQGPTHEWARAPDHELAARIGTAVSADQGEPGLTWVISKFHNLNPPLFSFRRGDGPNPAQYQLTPDGWIRYGELSRRVVNSRDAFMAMQFGEAQLDHVLRECFKPAAARAGFTLRPLNEKPEAGLIDNQIRAAIRTARFVLADLTHANKGAYFEAGFAEGLGIPVIYTCRVDVFKSTDKKVRPHFDTNHMHTIEWDPDKLEDAGKQLTATIRNTLPGDAKFDE